MVGVLDSNKNNKKLDLNNANHDSEEDLIWFLYEKMNKQTYKQTNKQTNKQTIRFIFP